MRPEWPRLESGQAEEVWAQAGERFAAQVAGPHFEAICREFMLGPGRSLIGGQPGRVGTGVVADQAGRRQIEVDVVVAEDGSGRGKPAVAMLGESKWGTVMGVPHLDRLARARDLLADRGYETGQCVLACFSAAGFTQALRTEGLSGTLLLTLSDLYG